MFITIIYVIHLFYIYFIIESFILTICVKSMQMLRVFGMRKGKKKGEGSSRSTRSRSSREAGPTINTPSSLFMVLDLNVVYLNVVYLNVFPFMCILMLYILILFPFVGHHI
jgi:hypothetical protein